MNKLLTNSFKRQISKQMTTLLSSEEGIITILSSSLMISDFNNPNEAIEEAIKTFLGNQKYFKKLILHHSHKSLKN